MNKRFIKVRKPEQSQWIFLYIEDSEDIDKIAEEYRKDGYIVEVYK